ncbi:MAG: hypothetical protein ACRDWI_00975 [Jiangellaceae bacterium]
MSIELPVVAGAVSTAIFALGMLPMLVKAARTKDLSSYSLGNIGLANVGNVVHSVYVFDLPAGPVWVLHSFYLVSTGLMLVWYVRYGAPANPGPADPYAELPTSRGHDDLVDSPDAAMPAAP